MLIHGLPLSGKSSFLKWIGHNWAKNAKRTHTTRKENILGKYKAVIPINANQKEQINISKESQERLCQLMQEEPESVLYLVDNQGGTVDIHKLDNYISLKQQVSTEKSNIIMTSTNDTKFDYSKLNISVQVNLQGFRPWHMCSYAQKYGPEVVSFIKEVTKEFDKDPEGNVLTTSDLEPTTGEMMREIYELAKNPGYLDAILNKIKAKNLDIKSRSAFFTTFIGTVLLKDHLPLKQEIKISHLKRINHIIQIYARLALQLSASNKEKDSKKWYQATFQNTGSDSLLFCHPVVLVGAKGNSSLAFSNETVKNWFVAYGLAYHLIEMDTYSELYSSFHDCLSDRHVHYFLGQFDQAVLLKLVHTYIKQKQDISKTSLLEEKLALSKWENEHSFNNGLIQQLVNISSCSAEGTIQCTKENGLHGNGTSLGLLLGMLDNVFTWDLHDCGLDRQDLEAATDVTKVSKYHGFLLALSSNFI